MSLNIPKNARISCYDYASALNMMCYSNNNIVINVINTIMLEIFGLLIHPSAILPLYFFLIRVATL